MAVRGAPAQATRAQRPRRRSAPDRGDALGLVARPRLTDRLDAAAERPLTLVSAAPGSGKTVALRQWVAASCGDRPTWITAQDAAAGGGALVARLAQRRRSPTVVLDDAHAIGEDVLVDLVAWVLAHPAVRLVMATRADPALPLHRLRVDGRLADVRGCDLAFDLGETARLLELNGVALPSRELELLQARTEGWAAGLRLATLLLDGHPRPEEAIRDFAGDDRAVVAFLVHEVLDRQPPAVREMLVRTSVLDRVSGPLADALTGGHGGHQALEELVRRNAFVEPLDRRGRWYRYHALFRDLLRAQLRGRGPDAVAQQHRRAARCFLRSGEPVPALRHAAAGRDWPLVDVLVRDHGAALLGAGGGDVLDRALGGIPETALRRRPFAATFAAARELDHGELDVAEVLLGTADEAGAALPGHRRRWLAAQTGLVRALGALRAGDAAAVRRHATRALQATEGLGAPVEALRATALTALGEAMVADGAPEAEGQLRTAAETARRADLPDVARRAAAARAWGYALDGHLRQAALAAEAVMAEGAGAPPAADLAWALAAYERGDIPAADAAVRRAAGVVATGAGRLPRLELELVRARKGLLVQPDERQALLSGLERAGGGWDPPARLERRATAARARLLASLGRTDEAYILLAERDRDRTWGAGLEAALASVESLRGDHAGAHARAVALGARAECARPVTVAALGTATLAAEALGDRPAALRALRRLLDLAEQDGLRLAPAELGSGLEPLLRNLLRVGTSHRALVGDVLELARAGTARPPGLAVAPLREPLSERELDVLRFLPTMLTIEEMAREMFVTLNTVKSHLRSIYRKLEVNGRRGAVERARALGLLAPGSLDRRG